MRWQIAQFTFCDQQQTLSVGDKVQQLEPMVVELLRFFCQHPDQIISKDQLIEQVWLGRVVSDNAVSKTITKLRKALADDVKRPLFIATFPKKGYKFIAVVEPINVTKAAPQQTPLAQSTLSSINDKKSLWGLLVVLFITVLALVQFQSPRISPWAMPELLTHTKALTRGGENEYHPNVSPDGTRLTYMAYKDNAIHLLIKDLNTEQLIEIKHEDGAGVGPATWSDDGTLLAYLVATPQRCQYYVRPINGLTLGEPTLIHNCPAGSYGKIIFTHDNNRLIYAETAQADSAYSLFSIDLTTHKKVRLTQPELFLGGNSQFDLHPTHNKLLISSPDKQQWEGFYSLDLDSDELMLLFKQDAYICCGIWSHDGERIVLMGEYPAYQLLSYNLAGKDALVIYSGSQQLHNPKRHTNGKDYLFISGLGNLNVALLDIDSGHTQTIANASVDDRLATLSPHGDNIAFISLRSGTEEIWLTDTNAKQHLKLSDFNDSRHYIDMQWSPNGEQLFALTFNEIHIINASNGDFTRLKIPQTEIRGVSFKTNNSITYSMLQQGQWQVYEYHLDTDRVTPQDRQWQYIQYQTAAENTLWLNQDDILFSGEVPKVENNPKLTPELTLSGRAFNLKKDGNHWYWFDRNAGNKIMRYSALTDELTALVTTNNAHFTISHGKLLLADFEQSNSDIYQTKSHAKK